MWNMTRQRETNPSAKADSCQAFCEKEHTPSTRAHHTTIHHHHFACRPPTHTAEPNPPTPPSLPSSLGMSVFSGLAFSCARVRTLFQILQPARTLAAAATHTCVTPSREKSGGACFCCGIPVVHRILHARCTYVLRRRRSKLAAAPFGQVSEQATGFASIE